MLLQTNYSGQGTDCRSPNFTPHFTTFIGEVPLDLSTGTSLESKPSSPLSAFLLEKETETPDLKTVLILEMPENDRKKIIQKFNSKYYRLLFYTVVSNLKNIPGFYEEYYIKVHLQRDVEFEKWEETIFSVIAPNLDIKEKIELWKKIEKIIDDKINEMKLQLVNPESLDKIRENFAIEVD